MTDNTALAQELEADRGANRELDARVAVALYDDSGHADARDNTTARLPTASDGCTPGTYWISAFSGLALRTAPDYTSDRTLKRLALAALRYPAPAPVGGDVVEVLQAALNWIDNDDCSQMGPAEDAAHTRLIRRLEKTLAALQHPTPASDEVRELVKAAYIDGATAVHNSWVAGTNGREPDFGEAASDYTAFAVERLASQPTAQPSDLVERVAKALAKADGLDFDEVCGVDANPDDGYCDSGTCVAAFYEDHDADHARGVYMRHARAAIAAMQGGDAVNVAQAWNSWWNNISTGANDKHMQTAFEAGFAAAIRGGE